MARALTEQESPQWKRIAQARHAAIAANLQKGKNALEMQNDLRPMKTPTSPSSHTPPGLKQATEEIQQRFIARALHSRDNAKQSGKYVSAAAVIERLGQMLLDRKCL